MAGWQDGMVLSIFKMEILGRFFLNMEILDMVLSIFQLFGPILFEKGISRFGEPNVLMT